MSKHEFEFRNQVGRHFGGFGPGVVYLGDERKTNAQHVVLNGEYIGELGKARGSSLFTRVALAPAEIHAIRQAIMKHHGTTVAPHIILPWNRRSHERHH